MRYMRFIFVICAWSMIMATEALSESLEYKAGRAATYIEFCGKYDLNKALHKKYGRFEDFTNGELDLNYGHLLLELPDCEKWKKFANELLGRTTTFASTRSNTSKKSPAEAKSLPRCTDPSYRHNYEGTRTYTDGAKYVGAFKYNKAHGQGIIYNGNGGKYVGAFKDGNRHGQGTYTYANDLIKVGIWEADKFLYAQKAPASEKSIAEKEIDKLRKENARLKKQQQSQPKQIAKKPAKKSPSTKAGGTGSGFFVSKLGHIVTNEHVVKSCESITVGDSATKQVEATLVEKDKRNDLALLRIS